MDGKNGELSKLKERMATEVPENGVDISSVDLPNFQTSGEATGRLQESGYANQSQTAPEASNPEAEPDSTAAQAELNKAVEEVKEGEVFSIKTRRPVNPDAPRGIVNQQKRDFNAQKKGGIDITSKEHEKEAGLSKLRQLMDDSSTPEPVKDWTPELEANRRKASIEKTKQDRLARQVERGASPEQVATYEKAYEGWREARDKAHKAEAAYNEAYHTHTLKEASTWNRIKNWPRRRLGLEPHTTDSLDQLKAESDAARAEYKNAAKELKGNRVHSPGTTDTSHSKLIERYQKSLSHHLTIGVHRKRLEAQQAAVSEAWENNKFRSVSEKKDALMRDTLEIIRKNPEKFAVVLMGAAVFAPAALLTVGTAVLAGVGMHKGLTKTWVKSSINNLSNTSATAGDNFLEKDFKTLDAEIGKLTFQQQSREEKTKTFSRAAAIATGAGVGGALYYNSLGTDGIVPNSPESGGHTVNPHPPIEGNMTPPSGSESPPPPAEAPEGVVPPQSDDLKVMADIHDAPPRPMSAEEQHLAEASKKMIDDPELSHFSSGPESVPPQSDDLKVMGEVHDAPPRPEPTETPEVTETESDNTEEPAKETETEEEPEVQEAVPVIEHEVVKGDTGWHIMKGDSSVLKDMSLAEQNKWQVKLWNSLTPEEAIKAGFVKSGGNVDLIYPGETINVSMLDQKLTELMHQNSAGEIPTPTPRPDSANMPEIVEAPENESIVNKLKENLSDTADKVTAPESGITESTDAPVTVKGEIGTFIVEHPVDDVDKMTVQDSTSLYQGVRVNDPNALALLEKMGEDKDSFTEIVNFMLTHGDGQPKSPEFTVGEYLNAYKDMPYPPAAEQGAPTSEGTIQESTPAGTSVSQPGDMPVREASVSASMEAVNDNGRAVQDYVKNIEQPKTGVFDRLFLNSNPSVPPTFEGIADMSIGDFKTMVGSENLQQELTSRGLSMEGVQRWGETLGKQNELIAANDNETVAQYLARVTSGTRAA